MSLFNDNGKYQSLLNLSSSGDLSSFQLSTGAIEDAILTCSDKYGNGRWSQTILVNGLRLNTTTSNGYVMKSDNLGNASWESLGGVTVTGLIGTADQVLVDGTSGIAKVGTLTLSLPQSIATTSNPTFTGLTVSGLVSKLLGTNASGVLVQSTISSPLTYSSNTLALGYSANLKLTGSNLDTVQDIQTSSSPTFAGITVSGLTSGRIVLTTTGGALTVATAGTSTQFMDGTYTWRQLNMSTDVGSGTLTAGRGGTSQNTYVIGDMLYASATTTLSKLAAVATGQVLLSQGTGTAPAWGTVNLSTSVVSGTLPVTRGGTNVAAINPGGVLFGGASGTAVDQLSSILCVNKTNYRVGIGCSRPTTSLTISNSMKILTDTGSPGRSAVTAYTPTTNGATSSLNFWLGWSFTVGASNLIVNTISAYDNGTNWTSLDRIWCLFNVTDQSLAYTQTIPFATTTVSSFKTVNANGPIVLMSGQTYIVMIWIAANGSQSANRATPITLNSDITYVQGYYQSSASTQITYPQNVVANMFGPQFTYNYTQDTLSVSHNAMALTGSLTLSNPLGIAYGGTGVSLAATGGTSQVLRQSTVGANITVSQLAASDLSNGTTGSTSVVLANTPTLISPLLGTPTSGVLTNCTGYPSSSLSGVVPMSLGGTNANLTAAVGSIVYSSSSALALLSPPASNNCILLGQTATNPIWSTSSYPNVTAAGDLLYASAANTVSRLALGTINQVLQSNGTTLTWVSATGVTGSNVVLADTPTISTPILNSPTCTTPILGTPQSGNLGNCTGYPSSSLSGAVPATLGGTAQSTYAAGDLLYASAINTLSKLTIGANTYVLTSNGTVPSWQPLSSSVTSVSGTANQITSTGTSSIVLSIPSSFIAPGSVTSTTNLTASSGFIKTAESISSAGALSTTQDSLIDGTNSSFTVTLGNGSTNQMKLVRLLYRDIIGQITVQCSSGGSFYLTPTEPMRQLRYTTNGWQIEDASSSNIPLPDSFFPSTQQAAKLVGTGSTGANVNQGWSCALSNDGNTVVIGANADNSSVGAAWVFTRSGSTWTQQGTKLVGTGNTGNSQQGISCALSGDGNTLAIGGYADNSSTGAVWVFTRSGSTWTQQGTKLVGTGNTGSSFQGTSVALSADGNTLVSGGSGDNTAVGALWVFTRSGGVWTQQGTKLTGSGATGGGNLGYWVSLSSNGNTLASGCPFDNTNNGATFIYTRSGTTWTQQSKLVATGNTGAAFVGSSVSLSADGNTLAVGARADNSSVGATWIFVRSGSTWSQQGTKLVGTGNTGSAIQGVSLQLTSDGNTVVVGGANDNSLIGAVWVFTRSGSTWTQQGTKLIGTGGTAGAQQGRGISISSNGATMAVGGPSDNTNIGATWIYI